jgi:hypothetical protein
MNVQLQTVESMSLSELTKRMQELTLLLAAEKSNSSAAAKIIKQVDMLKVYSTQNIELLVALNGLSQPI